MAGIHFLDSLINSAHGAKDSVRRANLDPEVSKKLNITLNATQAADYLGRTVEGMKKAEERGKLPAPKTLPNGRRFYTVEDLEQIRRMWQIKMGKEPHEDAVTIAIQNFKGGVSKSTLTKHFADYLALRGYKVLVIDSDPQASLSTMFDINLRDLVEETHVLSNFYSPNIAEASSLKKCIRRTIWPNIDIIPSNLRLGDAEWEMMASVRSGSDGMLIAFNTLKNGFEQIRKDYDVILMDPPPALGFLGVNCMLASDALIIPVPAKHLDYLSTIHFMETLREILMLLEQEGAETSFSFIRVLTTMLQPNRANEAYIYNLLQKTYGAALISNPVLHSEEIKYAGLAASSIYEMNKPHGSHEAFNRCRQNLNLVFKELEREICRQWPSRIGQVGTEMLTEAA